MRFPSRSEAEAAFVRNQHAADRRYIRELEAEVQRLREENAVKQAGLLDLGKKLGEALSAEAGKR